MIYFYFILYLLVDLNVQRFIFTLFSTVDENIIDTTKIQNNYVAIQSLIFSIAPCKVITLNPLCSLFGISSLLLFDGSLSKVIALPTIAKAIVVALSRS